MNIIHACNRYYPDFGGSESHVQNISEKMVELGHQVQVYTTDPSGSLPPLEEINGVGVHRFKSIAPNDSFFFSTKLYQSLKNTNCDIVHGHDLNGFPLLAATISKGTNKLFGTLHVGCASSKIRALIRLPYNGIVMHNLLKKADKIICVSEYERIKFEQILKLPSDKFVVIPNGYNLKFPLEKAWVKGSRTILSVGRLERAKGFHFLLQSFALIHKIEEFKDVEVVIVGKGPFEPHLKKQILDLGLTESVHIYQDVPRSSLLDLYDKCSMFVLLSNYESAGLAVWDAFAYKKPTITSTAAVLGEYALKGYSIGVDLPPKSEELATIIQNTLRNPEKYRAKEFKMLSWDQVAEKIISIYNQALIQ